MKRPLLPRLPKIFSKTVIVCFLIFAIVLSGAVTAFAQDEVAEQVQIVNGAIFGSDDIRAYTVNDLSQGEKLSVYVEGTSGNLDPFIALLSSDQLGKVKFADFDAEVQLALDNNRDPLLVISEFSNKYFSAWDDDSGGGFSSALEYTIPADGNYLRKCAPRPGGGVGWWGIRQCSARKPGGPPSRRDRSGSWRR